VPNPQKADGKPVVFEAPPQTAYIPTGVVATVTLTEPLQQSDPVAVSGSRTNSADMATFGQFLGLAVSGGNAGSKIEVYVTASVSSSRWAWAVGSPIFLNGFGLSESPPTTGYLQQIGVASGPETIQVRSMQPIQL